MLDNVRVVQIANPGVPAIPVEISVLRGDPAPRRGEALLLVPIALKARQDLPARRGPARLSRSQAHHLIDPLSERGLSLAHHSVEIIGESNTL